MRFAEEANYFQTTVHPATSMGEVQAMLDEFGADAIQTMTGTANDRSYWMIRFRWMGKFYRFTFQPLVCENPEKVVVIGSQKNGKRVSLKRTALEQSKYQMGRIAVNAVKAVLTAAEAMPGALFGFAELPATNEDGFPVVVSEVNLDKISHILLLAPKAGPNE
jgi:hypothetical protein